MASKTTALLQTPDLATLPSRPRLLVAACWLYLAGAILNLLVGAWTLSFVPGVVVQLRDAGQAPAGPALTVAVLVLALATLAFSAALIALVVLLRRGSSWARPALITVSILSLAALLAGGFPAIAVIVILAVAGVVATRAPVSAWLRAARGQGPA